MRKTANKGFTYRSYNFIGQDPVLDIEKAVIQRSGLTLKEIHERGGSTVATLKRHMMGDSRTTKFDTLAANIRAAGGDIQFVLPKSGGIVRLPKK